MADQRISELTAITGANTADDDLLVIVDTSASQTKKITLGELENALAERDFNFGDNDKLTFGAGSDLQIYHTSSASYITDSGTGNLYLGADNLRVTTADGLGFYFTADNGGASTIYHNASPKLATTSTGVDVTGTVTADGLTVDGTSQFNNDVNMTAATSTGPILTVGGGNVGRIELSTSALYNAFIEHRTFGATDTYIGNSYNNDAGEIHFVSKSDDTSLAKKNLTVQNNGDISFYEDTGTTAKFFWDASAERLGIGTSSPSGELHVLGSGGGNGDSYVERTSGAILHQQAQSALGIFGTSSNHDLAFKTNGSVRMRIDTSGNVGIGTSSPTSTLDLRGTLRIDGGGNSYIYSNVSGVNFETSGARFTRFLTNSSEAMRIDSSGNVGIGTSSPQEITHIFRTLHSSPLLLEIENDGYLAGASAGVKLTAKTTGGVSGSFQLENYQNNFRVLDDGAERMRIDSSGNLLVSKTSSSFSTVGSEFGPALNSEGWVGFLTSNNTSANVGGTIALNRKSTDGDIARFFKDGTTVGSIGTQGGDKLTIGNGDVGVAFNPSVDSIYPWNTATNGARDASVDLGYSDGASTNIRFRNLYLSGGVYLGGTGSANKLDDYEEGTFTPEFKGDTTDPTITYVTQSGYYTKVGRVVHVRVFLHMTGTASGGSGGLYVGDLPFTAANQNYVAGTVSYVSGWDANLAPTMCLVNPNTTKIPLYYPSSSDPRNNSSRVQVGALGTNTQIYLAVTYNV